MENKFKKMKEIKFRQFFQGKFHFWGNFECSFINPLFSDLGEIIESQQFTELQDKNGNK